jgi:hypothetical protein
MTAQQVGVNSSAKGDGEFMQKLNVAWSAASQATRDSLAGLVHTDESGYVSRIDGFEGHPALAEFVRTFANGKLYIEHGTWDGKAGNPADDSQSKAGEGSKDILLIYSDDETAMPPATASIFTSLNTRTADPATETGIDLTNASSQQRTYAFFNNYWNGNGAAGANFDHPDTSVALGPGEHAFVPLPAAFKGRVQRGTEQPATWVEFQLHADDGHGAAWGNVSVEQGCDGPATIAAADGAGTEVGFAGPADIVDRAPEAAVRAKPSGERAVDTTVGNWNPANGAAVEYLTKEVGQEKAYILGGTGTRVAMSRNGQFKIVMY